MDKVIKFKVVDDHQPDLVYGELALEVKGREHLWTFKRSEDISEESWKAFGLFPASTDGDKQDSMYMEGLLKSRVPLKFRIKDKETVDELVDIISKSGLRVASDSYKFVPASS